MPEAFDPNWKKPEEGYGPGYTLEDLMTSAPVHELHAEEKSAARMTFNPTDFAALRNGAPQARRTVPLSLADYFIDALTPTLIFVMALSFILFMLDLRFIFTEVDDVRLRVVSIFFVLGVVALNRLVARDGREQSFIYIFFLVMVVTIFTFATAGRSGSYAVGFTDRTWVDLPINLSITALLWWAINRLTHECCVDKTSASGEIGIVQGTLLSLQRAGTQAKELPGKMKEMATRKDKEEPWILTNTIEAYDPLDRDRQQAMDLALAVEAATAEAAPKSWKERLPAKHPGISVFYVSVPVMAAFALGYPVLLNGGPSMVTAGYVFVATYTLAALGLLMFTSLRGLRGYCQERNVPIPTGVSGFWMGFGGFLVVLVLLGGLLGPAPGVPAAMQVGPREMEYNARHSAPWDYREYESSTPRKATGEVDPELAGADGQGEPTPGAEPGAEEGDDGASKEGQPTSPNPPPASSAESDGGVKSPLVELMAASDIARYAVIGVVVVGVVLAAIVVLLYGMKALGGRGGEKRPGMLQRIRHFFEGFLAVAQVPGMRPWKVRMSRELSACAAFRNPMEGAMPLRDKVRYSYDALCALAEDMGQPRDPDRTPHEFMREFPDRLAPLREEAEDLTRLFVIAEYSNLEIQNQVEDRLRKFWMRYDNMRRGLLR